MLNKKHLSSTILFIFGGSGDLNYRKLTPALFNLFLDGSMPDKFNIIGIARTDYTDEAYKQHLKEGIDNFSRRKGDSAKWNEFSSHLDYLQMDISDANAFQQLADIIKQKEQEYGEHPVVIFYMAVAPQLVPVIVKNLGNVHVCDDAIFLKCYAGFFT